MSTKLLIDGDVLVFAVACACEVNLRWDDGVWTTQLDERTAFQTADAKIKEWKAIHKAKSVLIALSDSTNWRKAVLPSYKSQRKGAKPLGWLPLRQHLEENYPSRVLPSLEADDVIGIQATKKPRRRQIIVSIDKDFKSIPGLLWNPDKPELGVVETSLEEADHFHMMQTLMGDKTDGYSGCPGIGPVKAEKILSLSPNKWKGVVQAYQDAGLSAEVALEQARVARILRSGEYDEKKQEVILWTPPS